MDPSLVSRCIAVITLLILNPFVQFTLNIKIYMTKNSSVSAGKTYMETHKLALICIYCSLSNEMHRAKLDRQLKVGLHHCVGVDRGAGIINRIYSSLYQKGIGT